jgi:fimbrial chaperone protein
MDTRPKAQEKINFNKARFRALALGAALLAFGASTPLFASASLEISPVLIEIPAGGSVATVDVRNDDAQPAAVQVRLFHWSQSNGEESLEPTQDVVASPPIATVAPHTKLNVRVIRVAKQAVSAEDSYRLVIDQLPQSDANGKTVVAMLLRQVLPVFFSPANPAPADVRWSIARGSRGYVLKARNSGDRRLRIAKIALGGGVTMGGGLLGYVLGHSEMSWSIPARRASFAPGARVTIRGDSDQGP